jgi:hypothetical protein
MNKYVVYNSVNGNVYLEGIGDISTVDPLSFGPTMVAMYYEGSLSHADIYVESGVVTQRQPMPLIATNTPLLANGTDENIISGIPEGVQVRWPDGQTDIVTGGEIRFSVDLAGTYTFQFTAVPYLDQEVVIEAIPAT